MNKKRGWWQVVATKVFQNATVRGGQSQPGSVGEPWKAGSSPHKAPAAINRAIWGKCSATPEPHDPLARYRRADRHRIDS